MRYKTIVADPPWPYEDGCVALGPGHGVLRSRQPLPYQGMTVKDICELPVHRFADSDCRLFCWTTNRYLRDAFSVLDAWGFRYRQTLVWHKTDTNLRGSVAPNSVEFLFVATKGSPVRIGTMPSAVVATPHGRRHSQKPESWLDYVELVSPGPYLELFARRQRFGWDTWGNESFEHVELSDVG